MLTGFGRSGDSGMVAESGVMCARLAQKGITGPKNFLQGVYGYYNVYGRGLVDPQKALADLGSRFECQRSFLRSTRAADSRWEAPIWSSICCAMRKGRMS